MQREGYTVYTAEGGREALEIIRREGLPNLVLLDIMMPDMDGFAVAAELRRMGDIPIIFLSALSDVDTKVEGLTLYAEDYVTKPFALSELLARIRRILLRSGQDQTFEPEMIIDERLRVNFAKQYAVVNEEQITLTPTENRILNIYITIAAVCCRLATYWPRLGIPSARAALNRYGCTCAGCAARSSRTRITLAMLSPCAAKGYCLPQPNQKFEDDSSPLGGRVAAFSRMCPLLVKLLQ